MTQFRTPNLGSTPYVPGQKAVTGYDPIEQFEKDFEAQVIPRIIKTFQSSLAKHHGLRFVTDEPDDVKEELVYNYNWMICALGELSSVSHHVVINCLAEAPFLIREAMLNIDTPLPKEKVYNVRIVCSKTTFDEEIYLGQLLLFATDVSLEPEHPEPPVKKRWGLKLGNSPELTA